MPFAGRRHAIVDRPRSSYAVEPIARPPSGRPPDDETRIFLDRCAHGWNFSREKNAARGQGAMALKAAIPQGPMVLKPTKPRENAERTDFISGHHAGPDSLWKTILSSAQVGQRF